MRSPHVRMQLLQLGPANSLKGRLRSGDPESVLFLLGQLTLTAIRPIPSQAEPLNSRDGTFSIARRVYFEDF